MRKIQVAVIDDHAVVRKGLKQLFDEAGNIEVMFEAADAEGLFEILATGKIPDIVILDINMPGRSGIDALAQITKDYKSIKTIMMSMYPADQFETRTLKMGAWQYIGKDIVHDVIVRSVNTIYSAKEPIISLLTEKIIKKIDYLPQDPTL